MARYRDAKCRLCRREGMKLFLKGARCFTDKCAIERRNYPPGQHGLNRGKLTPFGLRLLELRLDNVVHRLGFAASRRESRQMVAHGHFAVNGRKASVPSMLMKVGDTVQLRSTSKMA